MSTPPRKFPLPCWTHDETLALIDAYREKWYSLHRASLRAPDWDNVAATVARRCNLVSPPKTAVQCRHKIEKLRKRYRSEKHRSVSYPGRFFSSWVFFPNMDSMEIGLSSAVGSNRNPNPRGSRMKNCRRVEGKSSHNFDTDRKLDGDMGVGGQGFWGKTLVDFDHDANDIATPADWNCRKMDSSNCNKPKCSAVESHYNADDEVEATGVFSTRTPVLGAKKNGKVYGISSPDVDRSSSSAYRFGKRSVDGGSKRVVNPIADMISAIKLLGDGYVKMEKMKMEMAREMEKMRMEMEMKRIEVIIESQQQIVDAFVSRILEEKKKKKKMKLVLPDS
ncbi:trihelix transcription factor ASIL2-like [Malania oleifera]|uniref:trihelix transcription factor ASIL2-like n=1 Tax=Malania oleifera TaxID=397392 RepID=UPI0025ADD270|nr:trihelix transcription factor ASIL2-like [Malania oleifera]